MFLLYHAYVYLEFLILACTIYILAPEVIEMKEYQHLIGKIIVAVAIIVAAIIIAQAIGGAGESIRSGLLQLGDALR